MDTAPTASNAATPTTAPASPATAATPPATGTEIQTQHGEAPDPHRREIEGHPSMLILARTRPDGWLVLRPVGGWWLERRTDGSIGKSFGIEDIAEWAFLP